MKKFLKIGAVLLALALTAGLVYLTNFFTGYPVSYFVVRHALNTYMEETYADTDFVAEKPDYALKQGGFIVEVHSPSSRDTHFNIKFNYDGTIEYDSYESHVKSGWSTASRLSREYGKCVEAALENADFSYPVTCIGSFDNAISGNSEVLEEPGTYPKKWDTKTLELDREYDISELSGQYGTLYLDVTTDDVSVKTASKALQEIKKVMEKADLPFRSVELWVFSKERNEYEKPKEQMHILNFGWDDISENGMEERVQEAADAAIAYYQ